MPREIEIGAVVNALVFLPAERKLVLDIFGPLGVMCQLIRPVRMIPQLVGINTEAVMPPHPLLVPVLEPLLVFTRLDEVLHLHLLEFPRAKDEVARRDLVAKRLAHLSYPKRDFLP